MRSMQLMDDEDFKAFEAVLALFDEYEIGVAELPSDSSEEGAHEVSAFPLDTAPTLCPKRKSHRRMKDSTRINEASADVQEIARVKAKLAVPGRNRSRDLHKLELLELRVEAAALQVQVDELHRSRGTSSDDTLTTYSGVVRGADDMLLDACESLAKRQKQLRREEENENQNLRELVEGQIKTIKTLKRLFQKQKLDKVCIQTSLCFMWLTDPTPRYDKSNDPHIVLSQLKSTLAHLRSETDRVLQSNRLGAVALPFFEVQTQPISATSSAIDIFKCEILPFDHRAVGNAFMYKLAQTSETMASTDAVEGEVVARDFTLDVHNRMKVHFRYTGAKYSEPGREVVVLSGRNKIEEVCGTVLDDVQYLEKSFFFY